MSQLQFGAWQSRWLTIGLDRTTTRAAERQRRQRDYKGSNGIGLTRDEVPCRNDGCGRSSLRYGERAFAVYNRRWMLLFCSERCSEEHRAGAAERRQDWLRGRG